MASDNIAGVKGGGIGKTLFLLPGRIIQWCMYMGVGKVKGYGKVRAQTRLARSPLMTYVYSLGVWFLVAILVVDYVFGTNMLFTF